MSDPQPSEASSSAISESSAPGQQARSSVSSASLLTRTPSSSRHRRARSRRRSSAASAYSSEEVAGTGRTHVASTDGLDHQHEYDYALAEDSISEWLKCPICLAPFVEPVLAPVCEHVFCRGCIEQHMSMRTDDTRHHHTTTQATSSASSSASSSSVLTSANYDTLAGSVNRVQHTRPPLHNAGACPTCRTSMSADQVRPAAKLICNMVDSLLVKCPHQHRGCPHVCERSHVEHHARIQCGWAYLGEYDISPASLSSEVRRDKSKPPSTDSRKLAPNRLCECGKRVLRKDVDAHQASGDCSVSYLRCPHEGDGDHACGTLIRESEFDEHVRLCSAKPVECGSCKQVMVQAELQSHLESCPSALLHCPLARFGCSWFGPREEIGRSAHVDDDGAGHLLDCPLAPLEEFLMAHEATTSRLRAENASMTSRLSELERLQTSTQAMLEACVHAVGHVAIDSQHVGQHHATSGEGVSRRHDVVVPILPPLGEDVAVPPPALRGRSGSSVNVGAAQRAISDQSMLGGLASSAPATASAPAASDGFPWQWPASPNEDVVQHRQDRTEQEQRPLSTSSELSRDNPDILRTQRMHRQQGSALPEQANLTSMVRGLSDRVAQLSEQLREFDRRLDDAHVVSHSAAFEAGRAHEELNSVRHGVHSIRLQMHSLLMMQQQHQHHQQQQRGSGPGVMAPLPPQVQGASHQHQHPHDQAAAAAAVAGLQPPLPPFGPGAPPMIGLRRFWTGFEQTKL